MCVHAQSVRLFATPWTVARQAPLSMGFSRLGYRSGLPCPPPGDLPHPGMEPLSLNIWQAFFFLNTSTTWGIPDICTLTGTTEDEMVGWYH